MPSLLAIESSPRGDYSVSRKLTQTFIDDWKDAHSGGTVVVRDLTKTNLPFVDLPWIMGAYTPAEQHSPEIKQALAISNDLIAELMAADHIVIGTSMYNFSIPANLKAYIDHIVRVGVTFSPSYEGLVKGKKAFHYSWLPVVSTRLDHRRRRTTSPSAISSKFSASSALRM